jgi:hypothetical protein
MKLVSLIIALVILPIGVLIAQLEQTSSFDITANRIYLDKLGNFYFQTDNQFLKTDKFFNKMSEYDSRTFGQISNADVSDPMRVLLYYSEFNSLIFLDNTLSILRAPINLDDLNLFNVDAICNSSMGSFRVYSSQTSSVITYDKDLKQTQIGANLFPIVEKSRAIQMKESNNYVFVLFDSGKVVALDKFGNYLNLFAKDNTQLIGVFNDDLFLITDKSMVRINPKTGDEFVMEINNLEIIDFVIDNKLVHLLTENSLITFKIL